MFRDQYLVAIHLSIWQLKWGKLWLSLVGLLIVMLFIGLATSSNSPPVVKTIKACPTVWQLATVADYAGRDNATAWKAFHAFGCVEIDPGQYEIQDRSSDGFVSDRRATIAVIGPRYHEQYLASHGFPLRNGSGSLAIFAAIRRKAYGSLGSRSDSLVDCSR